MQTCKLQITSPVWLRIFLGGPHNGSTLLWSSAKVTYTCKAHKNGYMSEHSACHATQKLCLDLTCGTTANTGADAEYQVPFGGLFEVVSCPNYLAETVEWLGFAVASNSWAAAAFAFYTFANLAPRAHQHHVWYKEHFPDYPVHRKAYIPYVW